MSTSPLPARPNLPQYRKQAKDFLKSFKAGDQEALRLVRRYHPRLRGRPDTNERNALSEADVREAKLTLSDAQCIIARRHQFESWPKFVKQIEALNHDGSTESQFELAADAIIAGDFVKLKRLLDQNPGLIRMRSTREHRATLLHYVGANAVESYRQRTPGNIVAIAELLLQAGAEVDADLDYGQMLKRYPERSGSTTLGMVATSCHPAAAGVQIPLLELLINHGASVNGLPGCWNPVIAALHNGRGHAAAYLARRGAHLNLEAAAGVGDLDAVKRFFSSDGSLGPNATKEQMEFGFMWACEYGRQDVVQFLLRIGVNINAQPHGETGLHWAAYGGHASVIKTLLEQNVSVNVLDQHFDGTPLGWALYGWCDPPPEADREGYYEVVARLVAAGAAVEQEWLAESQRGLPMTRKLQADKKMLAALGLSRSGSDRLA
jgi:ankyrin repeat protein